MLEGVIHNSRKAAWGLLIFLLPVTSMPLVRELVRSSTVAAPSILPLLFLLLVWLVPFLARRGRLPGQSLPLFGFALVAVVASAAAYFLPVPPFKNFSVLPEELTALVTLLIGLCFYLVTATLIRDDRDLAFTLRWINWGGLLIILWALAQSAAWYQYNRYPGWMRDLQDLISLGPLIRQRPNGLAYEPSWLAHQLNILYLPLWLSASLRRTSAHSFRLGKLSFENLLLVGGGIVLLLSFSRVGLLAFLAVLTFLFIRFNIWLAERVQRWWIARSRRGIFTHRSQRLALSAGVAVILLVIYGSASLGGLFVLSKVDRRMANVFELASLTDSGFLQYANTLQFGDRVVYWQAGWEVFNDHPWLGVGLGNAGFFLPEKIPAYGWQLLEVRRLLYRTDTLLNTKNLWARILSETGLFGFAFFAAWIFVIYESARSLQQRIPPVLRTIGDAGVIVLIALIFEGFSIDSFALPYLWISIGLVTSATRLNC